MSERIKPIVMPKWGLAMQEGLVAKWLVDEGAEVTAGQEILDIETSKIANVFESPVTGRVRRRVAGEGEAIPVGALLAVVADDATGDAEIEGFVARFQEDFQSHAREAAAALPEPATVEVSGRRIRYLELGQGDGPPVLLIHGFGGDLNNWQYNQEALAQEHRTIAIDLPGHGGSSKDVDGGDIGSLTTTVQAFLDQMAIERVHLVGHSLGGAVALELAQTWPERIASVTLISPVGLGSEINMDYIRGFMAAKRRKQMQPVLEMLVADPAMVGREMIEDVLRYKRLDGVEVALRTVADAVFPDGHQSADYRRSLAALEVPCQIIWGCADRIVPARHGESVEGPTPVHWIENAAHMAHMEQADQVNRLISLQLAS